MPARPTRDRALLNTAGFIRSFGVGFLGVVLGIYLFRIGFSSLSIGLVVGAGLAGSALATLAVSFSADRLGRRRALFLLALLSATGGLTLALTHIFPALLVLALISMLNGTGTDRSASYALEQAVIPGLAASTKRTWNLAFYNVLVDGGGSLGALCAGLPIFLQPRLDFSLLGAYLRGFPRIFRRFRTPGLPLSISLARNRSR